MFDTMTTAAVSLKNVHLTLPSRAGNVDILRGVDLDVRPGEALGIVGPSGSGKTTLLMVIAGLEKAYYRSIRRLIEEGNAEGSLAAGSPGIAALGLIGMLNWTGRWYREEGTLRPSEIAELYFALFYEGAAPRRRYASAGHLAEP